MLIFNHTEEKIMIFKKSIPGKLIGVEERDIKTVAQSNVRNGTKDLKVDLSKT